MATPCLFSQLKKLLSILMCFNVTLILSLQGAQTFRGEKVWQYGRGIIQDFDWVGTSLFLATSTGIWHFDPAISKSLTKLNTMSSPPSNKFEAGNGWTYRLLSSKDGTRFISVDDDSILRVRNAQTGAVLASLVQRSTPHNFAWQPAGVLLAMEDYAPSEPEERRNQVGLWDTLTGKQVGTVGGYASPIVGLNWHPSSDLLAVRLADGTVVIEDVKHGKQLHKLVAASITTTSLEWSPDGTKLAAAGNRTSPVKIWRTDTFDILGASNQPTFVTNLAWNTDSKRLTGMLPDGTIRVWNIETGDVGQPPPETSNYVDYPVERLAWNGDQLAILDHSRQLYIWNTHTSNFIDEDLGFTGELQYLAASHNGKLIALSYRDADNVIILDGTNGTFKQSLIMPSAALLNISDMAWDPSDQYLAIGSEKTLYIWHFGANLQPQVVEVSDIYEPKISWSPDYTLAVVSKIFQKEELQFIDAKTSQQIFPKKQIPGLTSVSWSPDGRWLAMYRLNLQRESNSLPQQQIDVWDKSQNVGVTINFPFSGASRMAPEEYFLWQPDSSHLIGLTVGAKLFWRWHIGTSEADIFAAGPGSNQADQALPLTNNSRGDLLATIAFGGVQIFDANEGRQLLSLSEFATTPPFFGWGGNDQLFIYDSTVQAYQIER